MEIEVSEICDRRYVYTITDETIEILKKDFLEEYGDAGTAENWEDFIEEFINDMLYNPGCFDTEPYNIECEYFDDWDYEVTDKSYNTLKNYLLNGTNE